MVVWLRRVPRARARPGRSKRAIRLRPSSLARYIAWSAATSTASEPASRLPPNIVMPTLIVAAPSSESAGKPSATCARRSSPSCRAPVGVGLRHQHRELVAGEAGDDVGGPHPLAQDRGDAADQVVAGLVPEAVVDLLEAVDVDDHHRALAAVAGGEGDVAVELGAEAAAVEEPGERVVVGQVAQLGLGLLGLRRGRPRGSSRSAGGKLLAAPPPSPGRASGAPRRCHRRKVLIRRPATDREPAAFPPSGLEFRRLRHAE